MNVVDQPRSYLSNVFVFITLSFLL